MDGQIIAPGGWCAPSDVITDVIAAEENDRHRQFWDEVDAFFERELERTKPPRGGIRYPVREQ